MNAVLKPQGGVIRDEPAEVYYQRRLDEANATGLKLMLRSPAHFRNYIETPDDDKETATLRFGRMVHCATLEPDAFDRSYIVLPANAPRDMRRFRDAKKPSMETLASIDFWDQFEIDNRGKAVVSVDDYDRAQRMGDSARAVPLMAGLLTGGEREITFRWTDPETGLACKARIDLFAAGHFMMDLKSCVDASPEGFARAVMNYKYDLQQAHYCAAARECGEPIERFVFLAIESRAPYVAQAYLLDPRAEERGWNLRQKAIRRQAECLRAGRWPGYSERIEQIALPSYAFYGDESE